MALFCLCSCNSKTLQVHVEEQPGVGENNNVAAVRWGGRKDEGKDSRKFCFLKEEIKE